MKREMLNKDLVHRLCLTWVFVWVFFFPSENKEEPQNRCMKPSALN